MTMRSNIEYSELLDNFELDTYESIFNSMYIFIQKFNNNNK